MNVMLTGEVNCIHSSTVLPAGKVMGRTGASARCLRIGANPLGDVVLAEIFNRTLPLAFDGGMSTVPL